MKLAAGENTATAGFQVKDDEQLRRQRFSEIRLEGWPNVCRHLQRTYKILWTGGCESRHSRKNGDKDGGSDEMSENGEYFQISGADKVSYTDTLTVLNLLASELFF